MKCPKCNGILPDDSVFCQFCGSSLTYSSFGETSRFENESNGTVDKQQGYLKHGRCKICGGIVDSDTKKCGDCGKQYIRVRVAIPCVIFALLLLSSIVLNVIQLKQKKKDAEILASQAFLIADYGERETGFTERITDLEEENDKLNDAFSGQQSTIDELRRNISNLQKKADNYSMLCKELSSGNIGGASSIFKTTESIIAVKKNEKDHKTTLLTKWGDGRTISTEYTGTAATISFDEDSWYTSTTLSIVPKHEGVSVVTFSNNKDSESFKLLIVVTE